MKSDDFKNLKNSETNKNVVSNPNIGINEKYPYNIMPFSAKSKEKFRMTAGWKQYQTKKYDKPIPKGSQQLIVCGKYDKSVKCLIIIDLDVSYDWINDKPFNFEFFMDFSGFPETHTVKTPRGGYHLYYLLKDDQILTNKNVKWISTHKCNKKCVNNPTNGICDKKNTVTKDNRHKRHIIADGLSDIDLRGHGGIVFAPPTKWEEGEFLEPYKALDGLYPSEISKKKIEDFFDLIIVEDSTKNSKDSKKSNQSQEEKIEKFEKIPPTDGEGSRKVAANASSAKLEKLVKNNEKIIQNIIGIVKNSPIPEGFRSYYTMSLAELCRLWGFSTEDSKRILVSNPDLMANFYDKTPNNPDWWINNNQKRIDEGKHNSIDLEGAISQFSPVLLQIKPKPLGTPYDLCKQAMESLGYSLDYVRSEKVGDNNEKTDRSLEFVFEKFNIEDWNDVVNLLLRESQNNLNKLKDKDRRYIIIEFISLYSLENGSYLLDQDIEPNEDIRIRRERTYYKDTDGIVKNFLDLEFEIRKKFPSIMFSAHLLNRIIDRMLSDAFSFGKLSIIEKPIKVLGFEINPKTKMVQFYNNSPEFKANIPDKWTFKELKTALELIILASNNYSNKANFGTIMNMTISMPFDWIRLSQFEKECLHFHLTGRFHTGKTGILRMGLATYGIGSNLHLNAGSLSTEAKFSRLMNDTTFPIIIDEAGGVWSESFAGRFDFMETLKSTTQTTSARLRRKASGRSVNELAKCRFCFTQNSPSEPPVQVKKRLHTLQFVRSEDRDQPKYTDNFYKTQIKAKLHILNVIGKIIIDKIIVQEDFIDNLKLMDTYSFGQWMWKQIFKLAKIKTPNFLITKPNFTDIFDPEDDLQARTAIFALLRKDLLRRTEYLQRDMLPTEYSKELDKYQFLFPKNFRERIALLRKYGKLNKDWYYIGSKGAIFFRKAFLKAIKKHQEASIGSLPELQSILGGKYGSTTIEKKKQKLLKCNFSDIIDILDDFIDESKLGEFFSE